MDEACKQPCTTPRADCGHPCMAPCHPSLPCPVTACKAKVSVNSADSESRIDFSGPHISILGTASHQEKSYCLHMILCEVLVLNLVIEKRYNTTGQIVAKCDDSGSQDHGVIVE